MDSLTIGIYEKALPPTDNWSKLFDMAKQAGYDFVEIAIDESDERLGRLKWDKRTRHHFHQSAVDAGVGLNSIVLSAHRRFPMGSDDTNTRQRAIDILYQAVDFAVETGFRMIQLAGYYVFYEAHIDNNYSYFCDSLNDAIEYASQAGVMLALENVDGEDILSIEKIMHFVEKFNSPYLQVYPDVGNLAGNGLNVVSELQLAQGHLVGIHLKDVQPNVFRRISFGEGIVPFVDVFQSLAQIEYKGNFLIEMWNDNASDSIQIAQQARKWIVSKMVEGGLLPDAKI